MLIASLVGMLIASLVGMLIASLIACRYYFNRTAFADFPDNLPAIWTQHFLAPARAARAALVVGEWGGRYVGDDELWQDRFKAFLLENGLSSFYWALNPNSGDTGGLLLDDWVAPHVEKQQMLRELPSSEPRFALASVPAFECLKHVDAANVPAALGGLAHGLFRCGNARNGAPLCVHAQQACNGVPECPDHTDERRAACQGLALYEAATAAGSAPEPNGGGGAGGGGTPVATVVPHLSPPCITVGGQDALRPCAFPFSYRGSRFTSCALDDAIDGKPWCPTAVDAGGHYFSFAHWGVCGPGCPKEAGRRLQRDGCEPAASGSPQGPLGGSLAEGAELPAHCAPPPSPPPTPPKPPSAPPLPPPASPAATGASTALLLFVSAAGVLALLTVLARQWLDPGPSAPPIEDEDEDDEVVVRRPARAAPPRGRRARAATEEGDEEDAEHLLKAQQAFPSCLRAMEGMD